jgi:hypothetical protein
MNTRNGILITMVLGLFAITAGATAPLLFDTNDTGQPPPDVPTIKPWRTLRLDPDYGGQWVVAADLDADGEVEFVACENHNVGDVHYTSTAVAHHLDGTVLWRWGDPDIARKEWHHDVACQIHDWDGDGRPEVILATRGALVELNGRTGQEKRRIRIADDATDCIAFADLAGRDRPTDIAPVRSSHTPPAQSIPAAARGAQPQLFFQVLHFHPQPPDLLVQPGLSLGTRIRLRLPAIR